jgi:hypothetical protein
MQAGLGKARSGDRQEGTRGAETSRQANKQAILGEARNVRTARRGTFRQADTESRPGR